MAEVFEVRSAEDMFEVVSVFGSSSRAKEYATALNAPGEDQYPVHVWRVTTGQDPVWFNLMTQEHITHLRNRCHCGALNEPKASRCVACEDQLYHAR